jgi:hypothetical protein
VNGRGVRFAEVNVEERVYVDARFPVRGKAGITVHYEESRLK